MTESLILSQWKVYNKKLHKWISISHWSHSEAAPLMRYRESMMIKIKRNKTTVLNEPIKGEKKKRKKTNYQNPLIFLLTLILVTSATKPRITAKSPKKPATTDITTTLGSIVSLFVSSLLQYRCAKYFCLLVWEN